MLLCQVTRQHDPHLVGKNLFACVVHNAAPVAIAVKGKAHISLVFQHGVAQGVKHMHVFRVRIVTRKCVIKLAIQRNDLGTCRLQHIRHEGTCRTVAAGSNDFKFATKLGPVCEISDVAVAHIRHIGIATAIACQALAFQYDGLEARHLVRPECQRAVRTHLDAGPAVFVVARRHHGDTRHIQCKL